MADHPIHNPKDYSEVLRQLLTTDPVHADTLNPLFERLLNNDAFIKAAADKLAADLAAHIAASDPHPGYALDSDLQAHIDALNPHVVYALLTGADFLGQISLPNNIALNVKQQDGTKKAAVTMGTDNKLYIGVTTNGTVIRSNADPAFTIGANTYTAMHQNNVGAYAMPRRQVSTGAFDFNNASFGVTELKSNNPAITFSNHPHGFVSGTLIQTEGSHGLWLQQFLLDQDGRAWYRTSKDAGGGSKSWGAWRAASDFKIPKYSYGAADANGKYTTWDYKLANTLYARVVFSNPDANGNYQTETVTYYKADGVTIAETETNTLVYDANGTMTQYY